MKLEVDLPEAAVEIYRKLAAQKNMELEEVLSDWLWFYAGFLEKHWHLLDS